MKLTFTQRWALAVIADNSDGDWYVFGARLFRITRC
jgi:hypothetical protein